MTAFNMGNKIAILFWSIHRELTNHIRGYRDHWNYETIVTFLVLYCN